MALHFIGDDAEVWYEYEGMPLKWYVKLFHDFSKVEERLFTRKPLSPIENSLNAKLSVIGRLLCAS